MADDNYDEPHIDLRAPRSFTRSESIGALAGALAQAQGEMEGAKKDAANPFFKSKYADLASVWDAIRGPLSKNGLAVLQFPRSPTHGVIEVETMLCHSSGEWVAETLTMPASQWVREKDRDGKYIGDPYEKFDVQTIGSAITYARRYGLQSICGVAPEDDDGNAAVGGKAAEASRAHQDTLRQKADKILAVAVKGGTASLETAWKTISADMRREIGAAGLAEYKKQAAEFTGDAAE